MHDDGDEEVEEDGGDVLEAVGVEHHVHVLGAAAGGRRGHRQGHVVVQRDEQRRHRGRDLKKVKEFPSLSSKLVLLRLWKLIDIEIVLFSEWLNIFQDTLLLLLQMSLKI